MRLELTFKDSEQDLYDFIKSEGKYTTVSGYIKQLVHKDMKEKSKMNIFKSKYKSNNNFLCIALYEGYNALSVYKLVETLDSFHFELGLNENCKPIFIYDRQINEVNQYVNSIEEVYDYIESYLESYAENCLNDNKKKQEEAFEDIRILRSRRKVFA